jgi:phosphatidylglycerophosphate synthase
MTTQRLQPIAQPRRQLATRNATWAKTLARKLGLMGVRPNDVSIAGVGFALCACLAFCVVPIINGERRAVALLMAAAAIQLRLLCNLLDGMLALEEGLKAKTGEIYNEMPDRVADVLVLVGAGYAVRDIPHGIELGWTAAVLALFTAYVRVLGGSLGLTQHFIGPMAKPHRMFVLTVGTVSATLEALLGAPSRAVYISLVVVAAGSVATAARRTLRLARESQER